MMLKFLSQNFWYDLALRTSYFRSLVRNKVFTVDEIGQVKSEFKETIMRNKRLLGDECSEFHLSWCSAILATYRGCLNKSVCGNEAVEITAGAIFGIMHPEYVVRHIRTILDRSADPFSAMVRASKRQEKKFFGNTFEFTRPSDDNDKYHLLVHRCFYNDFFRINGAPELMTIACRWDLISWSQGIVPEKHGIKFSRLVTLGFDGKACTFDFERIR
jgi:hypothetical protein